MSCLLAPIQACGRFYDEDHLAGVLLEAKKLHMRRKLKRNDSFVARAMRSFSKGVNRTLSRHGLLENAINEPEPHDPADVDADAVPTCNPPSTWREENTKKSVRKRRREAAEQEPKRMAHAIISRADKAGYGVQTFEFEAVDAQDMKRNATGALIKQVYGSTFWHWQEKKIGTYYLPMLFFLRFRRIQGNLRADGRNVLMVHAAQLCPTYH